MRIVREKQLIGKVISHNRSNSKHLPVLRGVPEPELARSNSCLKPVLSPSFSILQTFKPSESSLLADKDPSKNLFARVP
jgi:hypothetical protein